MPDGILAKLLNFFEGDPGVRKLVADPALTAELLLLFRVALADGKVDEHELDGIKRIAEQAFGIPQESFPEVVHYLQDVGYETTGKQAAEIFRAVPFERKKALIEHMTAVATADHDLDQRETNLIRRTIALLNEEDGEDFAIVDPPSA